MYQYLGYSGKPWVSAVSLAWGGCGGGVMLGGWYHCVSISWVLGQTMGGCSQPCRGVSGVMLGGWYNIVSRYLGYSGKPWVSAVSLAGGVGG